jgi:hypothetical protein
MVSGEPYTAAERYSSLEIHDCQFGADPSATQSTN